MKANISPARSQMFPATSNRPNYHNSLRTRWLCKSQTASHKSGAHRRQTIASTIKYVKAPHSILEHAGSNLLPPKLSFIESITGSCLTTVKLDTPDTTRTRQRAENFIVRIVVGNLIMSGLKAKRATGKRSSNQRVCIHMIIDVIMHTALQYTVYTSL